MKEGAQEICTVAGHAQSFHNRGRAKSIPNISVCCERCFAINDEHSKDAIDFIK
jgi:hypothetical protein